MEGAHIIEVNDLVISMASKLKHGYLGAIKDKNAKFPLLQKMRRLPYDADNDVYQPSVVSIGPYHHKSEPTLEMEQLKWESLYYILGLNPERKMRDYLEAMAGLEEKIRSCYANEIKMDSDELLKMMLLDGCFIICTFYGTDGATQPIPNFHMLNMDERNTRLELNVRKPAISNKVDGIQQASFNTINHDDTLDNPYASRQWCASFFAHDLLLLENQIPFFVVVKIYELVTNGYSSITVLLENVAKFMEDLLLSYPKAVLKFDRPKEIHYSLHWCHQYFKPNQIEVESKPSVVSNPNLSASDDYEANNAITGQQLLQWHQASKYNKAGIDLKKRECSIENPYSLLDIRFCGGVMEMPCLTIDTNTHCLFCNLIAFEETCLQLENYITAYVVFLSQFISMPEDVSLLMKRGIILHQLDSDAEVSDLFKMLAKGVTFDLNSDHYLKNLCHEMEVHYQMQRPRWREWLGSIGSKLPSWAH